MSVVAIIQARMGSSRLPGKILLPLPTGRIVLREVIRAAKRIDGIDGVVVAIPDGHIDDVIIPHIAAEKVEFYRGPEHDVLRRFHEAATWAGAKTVMRITADCPLIDPGVCSGVLALFKCSPAKYDYVSNTLPRTYPKGLDCEVFSMDMLDAAHRGAIGAQYREHVTSWIYESWYRPNVKIGNYADDRDFSDTNWSLDDLNDYHRICGVMTKRFAGPEKA